MAKLLRMPAVNDETGLKESKNYELIAEGLFPPPVKVGRASMWPADEVDAINKARIAGKSDDDIRQLVTAMVAARAAAADALHKFWRPTIASDGDIDTRQASPAVLEQEEQ